MDRNTEPPAMKTQVDFETNVNFSAFSAGSRAKYSRTLEISQKSLTLNINNDSSNIFKIRTPKYLSKRSKYKCQSQDQSDRKDKPLQKTFRNPYIPKTNEFFMNLQNFQTPRYRNKLNMQMNNLKFLKPSTAAPCKLKYQAALDSFHFNFNVI